jgi:glutamate/tyrosine decarboxylase-like PLP-dependent enzyme
MANVTALAAARHEVLRRVGWDVEADGLQGAPRVHVVAGREAHSSLRSALRLIGFGTSTIRAVEADAQGRMIAAALERTLDAIDGPLIVCAQSGNVNTGAFDPLAEIVPLAHARGAWVHVDGAFGLWAAASSARRHHLAGADSADSWALDGHKWLNVPYDCGIVIVAHPAAHRAAMSQTAAYLLSAEGAARDGMDWTPEASRRARANTVYAALRALGRRGVEDLVERCCTCARRLADRLAGAPGVELLNEVVLNQVLVRFRSPRGENMTGKVAAAVQRGGELWAGGTTYGGEAALRISISGWRTTIADVDRAAAALEAAHAEARGSS